MDIQSAVEKITKTVKPQRVAAKDCGYTKDHFCYLLNRVRRDEKIPVRAEKILVNYAESLGQ